MAVRSDATPRQIDDKYRRAGWKLDPHTCPDCQQPAAKEKGMTSSAKPSPAAMKAQVAMFQLLSDHFDADTGRYGDGWHDKRVGTETGLAPDVVAEFRKAGFGDLKESPEVASLRTDINALEQLAREQNGALMQEVAGLRARLAKVSA